MRFEWDIFSRKDWQERLDDVPRSNLLNTWSYAEAMRHDRQMMTRFGALKDGDETRALIALQEVRLGPLHIVTLHRGPLWLGRTPSLEDYRRFLTLFGETFPRRPLRIRRLLPEIERSADTEALMDGLGYKRIGDGYQTYWLDLTQSLEALRSSLASKWRNALNRSEREELTLEKSGGALARDWLLSRYAFDKATRNFGGASRDFLQHMLSVEPAEDGSLILRAFYQGQPIAGILIICHGTAATYQVGWNSPEGRTRKAHHFLLWQAIKLLKEKGVGALDLGGVNPGHAEGVTRFKEGLKGTYSETVGLYK